MTWTTSSSGLNKTRKDNLMTNTTWRFAIGQSWRVSTDPAHLLRVPDHHLTTLERGLLVEALVPKNAPQCPEALAFHGYCTDLITVLGPQPTLEMIAAIKLRLLDRFVHLMGVLPPSHYVHLRGYAYPFHPCVPEVLYTVHEHLSNLAATARSRADFEGLLLGYEERSSQT